jgi:hypothetical protein
MNTKSLKHQQAQDLYLHTDKTQDEIADILDVNRKTVYLWVKNGNWQEIKKAASQTPGMMRVKFYKFMDSIINKVEQREDECPTPQEVNMLHKLMKMNNMISGNHVGSYIQAFDELIRFICSKDLSLGQQVVKIADNYVRGSFGDFDFHYKKEVASHLDNVTQNLAKLDEEIIPELPADKITPAAPSDVQSQSTQTALPDLKSESHRLGFAIPVPHQDNTAAAPSDAQSHSTRPGMCNPTHKQNDSEAQKRQNAAFEIPAEKTPKPNTGNTFHETDKPRMPQNKSNEANGAFHATPTQLASLPPATASFALQMSADPFTVEFNGFWTEEYSCCIPPISGIYSVYQAYHDKKHNVTNPLKLLAIGESDNIRTAVAGLLPTSGWHDAITKDTILCFSYADVGPDDRLRIAGALINHHKPHFNTTYKYEYPFGKTEVHTQGHTPFLAKSFTVTRQEIKKAA